MTYKTIVKNGVIPLPPEAAVPEGTEVEVTIPLRGTPLEELLELETEWHGDDSEEVLDLIYRTRSSRTPPLDQ